MFEAGDTALEFSLLDPRLLQVGFLSTVAAETGRSFVCQLTTRDGNLCGELRARKRVRISCGLLPVLRWQLCVRCSLLLVRHNPHFLAFLSIDFPKCFCQHLAILGQTWSWPNLVWPNLVLAKLGLGQTWSPNLARPNLVSPLALCGAHTS